MKMTSFKIFLFFLPDGRIRMEDRTQLDLRKYLVRLTPVNWGVDPPGLRGRVGVGVAMTVGGRRRPRRPRPGWRRPAEVMRRTTSASWETLGFPFRDLADWELWRCCCHQMASIKIVSDQPLQIIKKGKININISNIFNIVKSLLIDIMTLITDIFCLYEWYFIGFSGNCYNISSF